MCDRTAYSRRGASRTCASLRVVYGDTLELPFGEIEERSRLVGTDTPEVYPEAEPYRPEASAYTEKLLPGQEVFVEIARAGYADMLTIAPNVQNCTSERCKKLEQPVEGCGPTQPTPDTSQTSGQ